MRHLAFALAFLAAPTFAFAQTPGEPGADPAPAATSTPAATPAPAATPTPAAAPAGAPAATATDPAAEPTPQDLIVGLGTVIDNWQNLGWVAGVIALINLLLTLLRFKPIDVWLTSLDYKWIKPLIATVLGAVFGGFSTFSTGAGVLNSIVAGMIAGLCSVGFHELMDKLRKRTTKPAEG